MDRYELQKINQRLDTNKLTIKQVAAVEKLTETEQYKTLLEAAIKELEAVKTGVSVPESVRTQEDIDKLKAFLARTFKSELPTTYRIELCIFEKMQENKTFQHTDIRRMSDHKYHIGANADYCKAICQLWEAEIKAHNKRINQRQTKLF